MQRVQTFIIPKGIMPHQTSKEFKYKEMLKLQSKKFVFWWRAKV
jgi:hypothetical protein